MSALGSIIFYLMEFLYAALSNEGSILRGKMSKWRHLEVVFTQLLLIGLLFFLILQNGQLKKEISSKLSHEFVEDIFNEKISQLAKEMEEIKMILLGSGKENSQQHLETKKIIRLLFTQLGLPISNLDRRSHAQKNSQRKQFQVIQFEENQVVIQRNTYTQDSAEQHSAKIQEKEFNSQQRAEMGQAAGENKTMASCSFYEYLMDQGRKKNTTPLKKLKLRQISIKSQQKTDFKHFHEQLADNQAAPIKTISPLRFGLSLFLIFALMIAVLAVCFGKGCRSTRWAKVRVLWRQLCGGKGSKKRCFGVDEK